MERTEISIEQQMQSYYESLLEKDRRRYVAIEAKKLGYGGISQIVKLLGCNYRTIAKGLAELQQPSCLINNARIRHPGGGRKRVFDEIDKITV